MKKYFRVMLGAKSVHAEQCLAEGFIGTDFLIAEDLTQSLPDDFRSFNNEFIPTYLRNRPDKNEDRGRPVAPVVHSGRCPRA